MSTGLARGAGGGTWQPCNHLLPAAPAIHGGAEDLAEEVMATVNGTVRFKCEATGHPVPTVSWLWNDVPIVASPRHQLLEGGTVLQVGVSLGRVAVLGRAQEILGGGVRALFPPQGGGCPGLARCQGPRGSPSSSPARSSPQWGSAPPLQVAAVEAGDTGSYMCVAENPAGSAEKHFALTVHGKASPATLPQVADLPSSSSSSWSLPWLLNHVAASVPLCLSRLPRVRRLRCWHAPSR